MNQNLNDLMEANLATPSASIVITMATPHWVNNEND